MNGFILFLKYWFLRIFKPKQMPKPGSFAAPAKNCEWNPLLKYPRNEICFCGSGLKFKKCCLIGAYDAVPAHVAAGAKPLVDVIRKSRK